MNKIYFLLLVFSIVINANSQTYLINSTSSATTCSGTIYDSGGSSGDYGNSENNSMVVYSATAGLQVQLSISYNIESGYDYLKIYNGTSSSASLLASLDGSGSITITGNNASEALYLVFTSDGSVVYSGFSATISCANPPAPTIHDCLGAKPICGSSYDEASPLYGTNNGEGNYLNEIYDNGSNDCHTQDDQPGIWYIFTVQTSGELAFTINPDANPDDYDWALFDLTNYTCEDLAVYSTWNAAEVSSNTAGETFDGSTGMNSSLSSYHNNCTGPGDDYGNQWNENINVLAGEQYALYIANFEQTNDGYVATFNEGSANIIDVDPPALDQITSSPACGEDQITFMFTERVLCSSVTATDFTITGPGGPYTVTSINCNSGATYSQDFTITLNTALTAGGTYSLNMVGQVDDACSNTTSPSSLSFNVTGVSATVSQTQEVQCYGGSDGTALATGSGGTAPYTYSWSGGAGSSATATGLSATTYTVTVTDNVGVCNDIQTITITQATQITSNFTTTDVDCYGTSTGSATVNASNGTPGYTYQWDAAAGSGTNATANSLAAGTYTVSVYDTHSCLHTNSVTISQPTEALAVDSIQLIEPSCNGGNDGQIIIHNIHGGTAGYSVAWNTGDNGSPLQNLAAGNYWGTITDAQGCIISNDASNPFVLGEPDAITATATPDDADCYGGNDASIALSASGGTPGYTYQWDAAAGGQTSSTASNLTSGTYAVTITDTHSCTYLNTYLVGQATQINITQGTINNAHCGNADGNGTVSATGGTGTLTYTWNTSPTQTGQTVSNVTAGGYTVTVSDVNSCDNTLTINIADEGAPSISLTSSTDVQCFGDADGSATVSASGGTGSLSYSWSSSSNTGTTENGLSAGTYTASVTDGAGCVSTANVTITEPNQLNAIISANNPATCFGYTDGSATVDVSGGVTSYNYLWDSNAGNQTTATASNIGVGTYTVTVTDAHSCSTTTTVIITQPTAVSIDATDSEKPFCFGDANGTATVVTVSGGTSVSGSYSYEWSTSPVQNGNQATGLTAGSYTVTVTDDNSCEAITTINVDQQTLLQATISGVDPLCNLGNDGNATVVGTGGVAVLGYTYQWDAAAGNQSVVTATGLSVGTYTVTVTDDNACTVTATVTLTEPTALNTNISLGNVSCNGGSDAYAIVTASDGTPGYTYNWSTSSTIDSIGGLSIGTYYVTVYDNNMCPKEDSVLISEPPLLVLTGSSIDVICHGENTGQANVSVVGGTNPYTFSWSNGETTQSIIDFTGSYTVTVTDNLACTEIASITINEPDTISVTTITNDPHCGNADGDAMVTPVGGVGSYSYLWSSNVGNDTTSNFVDSLIASPYAVTVYDGNNCEYVEFINLSDLGAATINVVNINHNQCFNDSLGSAEVSIISGGTAPFTYTWVAVSGTIQTGSDNTIDSIPEGTYSVVVEDNSGCTSTQGFSINQDDSLYVNWSIDSVVLCHGDTNAVIAVIPGGGTNTYTYQWDHTSSTDSIVYNLAGSTYTVTVTDDSLCFQVVSISLNDPDELSLILDTSINVSCYGGDNGYISVLPDGGTANYNYLWDNGDSSPSADSLITGYHTVTLTDAHNCVLVDSFEISQPTPISFNLTSVNSVCGGTTGSLTINASGGTSPYSYEWIHDTLLTSNTANSLSQGDYNFSIIDSLGCTLDSSGTVVDDGAGTASISSVSDVLCNGESTGTATIDMAGGTADFTYVVSMAGINIDSTQTSNPSYDISNLVYGTYDVDVYDVNGCLSTTTFTINQPTELKISDSTINVDCYNGSTGAIYITAYGGTPSYLYNWDIAGTDSVQTNLSAGFYSITVVDVNACEKHIDSIQIMQPTEMLITLDNATNLSCNNDSTGSISISATGGTPDYTYAWNNGQTGDNLTGLNAGTYIVTITDNNYCNDTMSVMLTQPSAMLIADSLYYEDHYGAISVSAEGGTPDYTYEWSNGETNNVISGLFTGDYWLTVTDANGCAFTNLYNVEVELVIPSVITPNTDGKNDFFRITNINAFEQVDIKIFNRWGDIIFDYSGTGIGYEDQEKQWDGFYNGLELPMGSYVYIVDLKNDKDPYTGTVTIVR